MPTSTDPGPSPGPDEALAGLVHDLRTPVMIVSGFAELLQRRDALTPQQRGEFVDRIAEAAGELRRLLDAAVSGG